MELRHLRYFVALAGSPTFTAAAERVHVTQSTLSHQIRQLEDELGVSLFQRIGKRHVCLSDAGQLFLNYAVRALSEVDSGRAALSQSVTDVTGEFRVAAGGTFAHSFFPECLARFHRKIGSIKVVADVFDAERILKELRSGDIHVGISLCPDDLDGLNFEPLHAEELVLLVGPMHPLYGRKRIRMAELHGQRIVLSSERYATRHLVDSCLRMCGARPVIVAEINSIGLTLALIAKTDIGSIVSRYAALDWPEQSVVHLEGPTPTRQPGILWKQDQESPFVLSFISIVREVALDPSMSLKPRLPL